MPAATKNKPSAKNANFTDWLKNHREVVLLVLILALAAFYRFWQLGSLPPGLHPDEAANGLDIILRIFHGDIRPLYNTNGPREALFFFLQAVPVWILGNTILALRIAPATIGVLAVLATYLWSRQWFGQRVALITAFLMAVTPWAVTISRDGYRAGLVPLFVPLTLFFASKLYETKKTSWAIWTGIALGGGFYTYLEYRTFPIFLLVALGFMYIWRRAKLKEYKKLIGIGLLAAFVVVLPLLIFGIKDPGDVYGARSSVSFMNPSLNNGHPLNALADSIVKTALMFNVHGDENYRQNLGGYPELNFFVGIMFILGLILALSKIKNLRYFALLMLFGAMLAPEALTAEGVPHALRSIGAMPIALVLAAIGISYMLDRWYATFPINSAARASGLAAILVLLGLSAYLGYTQYFVAWGSSPQTYAAYSEDAVSMANYLNAHKFNGDNYVLIDGYTDKTIQYLTYGHSQYKRLDPNDIASVPADNHPKEFLISVEFKHDSMAKLTAKYPKAQLLTETSKLDNSPLYYIYQVQP